MENKVDEPHIHSDIKEEIKMNEMLIYSGNPERNYYLQPRQSPIYQQQQYYQDPINNNNSYNNYNNQNYDYGQAQHSPPNQPFV